MLTFCLSFSRFGLSNRFDTEFPSVLTGKVQFLYSCTSFLLFVQFQVGRINQLKPQWFNCSFGPLTAPASPNRPIQTSPSGFEHFKERTAVYRKEPECAAVQLCKWVSGLWGTVGGDPSAFEGPAPGDKIMKWRRCRRQERKASWVGRRNTKRLQG